MLLEEIKSVIQKGTKSEYRKFGLTVGIFLLVLGGFFLWRGKGFAEYLLYIGGFLTLMGLIIPVILKPVYIGWMSFAVVMGHVMTRVLLTLIYSILFVPVGLVIRLLGKDPLKEKWNPNAESYWIMREKKKFDPKSAENQY